MCFCSKFTLLCYIFFFRQTLRNLGCKTYKFMKALFLMQPIRDVLNTMSIIIKGALDKYNIYLFTFNSIEDFKSNQYRNFQLILLMRFHFMRYFVISIIYRVSHRLLYCKIYWSRLWKIENARNIHISSEVSQSRTWNSACGHCPCQHF